MKVVCVLLLICLGGIVVADPIADAVYAKATETLIVLSSVNGYFADIVGGYISGELTVDDLIEALKMMVNILYTGVMDLDGFIRNVEALR